MKFFLSTVLTMLLSFVFSLYLPWWSISAAAFLVAVTLRQSPLAAFLTGFLGLFALWGGLAWWIDMGNEHLLSAKMAAVLPFGGSASAIIVVTAFAGALVAAFAALTASYLRRLF